jgi:integral membrane protein
MLAALDKFERYRPFSDKEAWTIFRVAAYGEAFGWSLLISGILIKRFLTPKSNLPVLIAGRMHGVFFSFYILAALGLYTSLRWSRKKVIIASLASVPPYGSLFFEQWAAYKRRSQALKDYRQLSVYLIVNKASDLLVLKPRHSGYNYLPGGLVKSGQEAEQALKQIVWQLTGIEPIIGELLFIKQSRQKNVERLELYFNCQNNLDFKLKDIIIDKNKTDELNYVSPLNNETLLPEFLRQKQFMNDLKSNNPTAKFV